MPSTRKMTIQELYPVFLQHNVISTDTRKIHPGSLFFALKGENFNGNDFAMEAIRAGASYAIVDDEKVKRGEMIIHVDDVLRTLQQLAAHHRKQFRIPVVAITGTNGKTTTKELCHAALSQKFNTVATSGNFNNHIGVPLTLLSITPQTEIAIIEMGANHPGEIGFLCTLAQPGYGLITNIGKAHLEGFGSFEGIVKTKTELYHYLKKNDGTIFLNADNTLLAGHAEGIRKVTYGLEEDVFLQGSNITADPFLQMDLRNGNTNLHVESHLYGGYNAENVMAAACMGFHFGVEANTLYEALSSYTPSNNRSQVIRTAKNLLILDAYNANPSSMELAISGFTKNKNTQPVLILGDMLELGAESDKEHKHILDLVKSSGFTYVYLVGPVFTRINTERGWHCFTDSELARIWLQHHSFEGATILLKGSRGMQLEKLVTVL
jgi:UDP-N-acetylmuramoyl-tripeptide--D-alanyl-D-alanine ligase